MTVPQPIIDDVVREILTTQAMGWAPKRTEYAMMDLLAIMQAQAEVAAAPKGKRK